MNGPFPAWVAVGAQVAAIPFGLNRTARGVVVCVPRHRRFAVVEFRLDGRGMCRRFRECVFISTSDEKRSTAR